jgi:hypothetical protein
MLDHVRSCHSAGGHVHLSTSQINQVGLVRCSRCFHVHLPGSSHPTTCVPSETPVVASLRHDLNTAVAAGTLIKVRYGQLPFVVNATWTEVFSRPMSTFDTAPKIPALSASIAEVFMLVSAQALNAALPPAERENALKLVFMLPFLLFQREHGKNAPSFTAQVSQRLRWFMANRFDELVVRAQNTSIAFQVHCTKMSKSSAPMLPKIQRVTGLVSSGDVGKAADLLFSSSHILDIQNPDTRNRVQALFPPRQQAAPSLNVQPDPVNQEPQAGIPTPGLGTLPALDTGLVTTSPDTELQPAAIAQPATDDADPTIITHHDVQTALARSHKAAAGPTGWHISFIKLLGATMAGRTRISDLLNHLMSESCPQGALQALHTAKLTVLSKSNGGVRPITTRDSWLRLLAKVIVCKEQAHLSQPLAPLQAGVGLPGGTEFVTLTIRHLLEANPSWCAVSIDCTNAYGCIKRDVIRDSLGNSVLCRSYFNRFCNSPITVRVPGSAPLEMAEGVAQGDPLSPLFFALALQQSLQITQTAMDTKGVGRTFAYLDDVILVGPAPVVSHGFATYKSACATAGLSVNSAKTQVLTLQDLTCITTDVQELVSTHNLTQPRNVISILGTPVGLPTLEAEEAVKAVDSLPFTRLQAVEDKQTRLVILRQCVNQSMSHLLRTLPPDATLDASRHHDAFVYFALACLLDAPQLAITCRIESSFPLAKGGLALPILEQQRHIAYLASSTAVIQTWRNYLSDDNPLLTSWLDDATPTRGSEQLRTCVAAAHHIMHKANNEQTSSSPFQGPVASSLPANLHDIVNFTATQGLQHKLSQLQYSAQCAHYRNTFLLSQHDRAQYLSKTGPGAAGFLQAIPSDPSLKMNNTQFTISLRMWLRMPILPLLNCPPDLACHCNRFDSTTNSYVKCDEIHIINCAGENARTQRHNDIVATFQQMYQSVMLQPVIEPMATAPNQSLARHDLSLDDGRGNVLKLDITVRSPLAHATLTQAAMHPLHVACKGVQEKITKYTPMLSANDKFVPIAIETFGGLHQYVQQQISFASLRANHLPPASATYAAPTFQSYWMQRISCTLWKANANLLSFVIRRTVACNSCFTDVLDVPSL